MRLPDSVTDRAVLGSPTDDPNLVAETEMLDRLGQKVSSALQALDQIDRNVAPSDRYRQPRQTRSAADVHYSGIGGKQIRNDSAVEQVPIPDPICLAWSDQTALDADGGQQRCKSLGEVQALTEHRLARRIAARVRRHGSVGQHDDATVGLLALRLAIAASVSPTAS